MLAVVALKQPAIERYTLYVSRGIELPIAIFTQGIIRPEDSGAAFEQKKTLFSGRLSMPGGTRKSPRHAQNRLLGE